MPLHPQHPLHDPAPLDEFEPWDVYEDSWLMTYVRGPEGIIVALAQRIGQRDPWEPAPDPAP